MAVSVALVCVSTSRGATIKKKKKGQYHFEETVSVKTYCDVLGSRVQNTPNLKKTNSCQCSVHLQNTDSSCCYVLVFSVGKGKSKLCY